MILLCITSQELQDFSKMWSETIDSCDMVGLLLFATSFMFIDAVVKMLSSCVGQASTLFMFMVELLKLIARVFIFLGFVVPNIILFRLQTT